MRIKCERENNGRMNGNKNDKNEDEFEKSVHITEREKKKSGHLHLTPRCKEQEKI